MLKQFDKQSYFSWANLLKKNITTEKINKSKMNINFICNKVAVCYGSKHVGIDQQNSCALCPVTT